MGSDVVPSTLPTLERFHVLRPLGAGAMGQVFEAEDLRSGARTALKMLSLLTPDAIVRFKSEFRSLRDLHHPNLVRLGELFEVDGRWFFTMEIVDGVDFLSFVRPASAGDDASPGFDDGRLRSALGQLAEGLFALHGAGKLHRDVKPSNIRVERGGRVVLLDFGLVTDAERGSASSEHGIVGTAMYMAPEQASAQPLTPAADWYAVGVTLYEALTGTLPFEGHLLEVLVQKQQKEPPPPRSRVASIPDDLDDLCVQLLRRDVLARAGGDDVVRISGRRSSQPIARGSLHPTASNIFLGRGPELEQLQRALDDVLAGQTLAMVVEGDSGVGKSALVRQFSTRVQSTYHDVLVLKGRCYERESVPFGGFDTVVDALVRHLRRMDQVDAALALPRDVALLARVFPSLHGVPAIRRATTARATMPTGPELRARAFSSLRELMERIAERTPLITWIDDFQWADADSLALLAELLGGEAVPRMLFILTLRTAAADDPAARALAALERVTQVRRIALQNLDAHDSEALARALCREYAAAGADTAAIVHEAAGHPYFLAELVRYAAARGQARAPRIEDALLYRIRQLDDPALALLKVVAAAGAPIATTLATAAAKLSPEQATMSLGVVRASTFVRGSAGDTLECYHDRVREAVYTSLGDGERRSIHAALAEAFEGAEPSNRDPHALVRHLLAAGETDRAARCAVEAGQLASETLAFERAADLYRMALSVGVGPGAARLDLTIKLAWALSNMGRTFEAAGAFLEAAPLAPTRAQQLELKRLASEHFFCGGYLDRGLEEMRGILNDIGLTIPRSPRAVLATLLWHRARLRLEGIHWTERDAGDVPEHVLQKLEVYKALTMGLGFTDMLRGATCTVKGLRLALATGVRLHVARGLGQWATHMAASGEPSASRYLAEAQRIAAAADDPYLTAFVTGCTGAFNYSIGAFRVAADELAHTEQALIAIPGANYERNNVRLFRLLALRHMGLMRPLAAEFDAHSRDARYRNDRFAETTLRRAANIVWLARGLPDEAAADLARTSWMKLRPDLVHIQHWYELRARIEIALYVGAGHDARALHRAELDAVRHSLLMRIQNVRAEVRWLWARCALAESGDPRHLHREVVTAVRQLRTHGSGFATVWAELLAAGLAAREGDADAAAAALRAAIELGAEHDILLGRAVAQWRLGQLVGGTSGPELVARGEAWMREQGVAAPAALAEVIAPGFSRAPGS